VVFPYYQRLSAANKRIYRRSAGISTVLLEDLEALCPLVKPIEEALGAGKRRQTEMACGDLTMALCRDLGVPQVTVKVLAARPSHDWGELHGLYTRPAGNGRATITIWMRTAQRRQVVSFRTFLRTLIHELLHHLDYDLFKLADSFHTEGFFQRESSLVKQLAGEGRARRSKP
jgi:hypothetical protein